MSIILLSGTAGSIKKKVSEKLEIQYGYRRVVTTTTRKPSKGESPQSYNFVDAQIFDDMKKKGVFLECETHCGFNYATTTATLASCADSQANSILIVTPEGVEKIVKYLKANDISYVAAYISEPMSVLVNRISDRRDSDSLSKEMFVEKIVSMVTVENSWRSKALCGKAFDLFFESHNKTGDLESIVESISAHVRRLNLVDERKKSAIKQKAA